VSVITSWQTEASGKLKGLNMYRGIGMKPDRETESRVKDLRDDFCAQMAMFLILIERIQDLVMNQRRSREISALLSPCIPERRNFLILGGLQESGRPVRHQRR
jgi:hypothetical protein